MAVCFCKSKRSQRPARASLGTECAQLPEATHLVSAGLRMGCGPCQGPDCLLLEPLSERKEAGPALGMEELG